MFVESYGRVAVQDSSLSPPHRRRARAGRRTAAGRRLLLAQRPLTSPTFGGLSWLAHSTRSRGSWSTASGDTTNSSGTTASPSPGRSSAPGGGRSAPCRGTAGRGQRARPSTTTTGLRPPQLGYCGLGFGVAPMPDQYTLWPCNVASSPSVTGRRSSPRSTSSRATRRGRVFRRSSPGATSATACYSSASCGRSSISPSATPSGARAAYGQSIEYSLNTIFSFVRRHGHDNLVPSYLATISPRRSSPAKAPATTCPSRSLPRTPR